MRNSDKPAFIQCEDTNMKKSALDTDMNYGLTKREYFAAMALNGLMAVPNKGVFKDLDDSIIMACKVSIAYADELLKQLEK